MIKSSFRAATLAALFVFGASEATAQWAVNDHNVSVTGELSDRASLLAVTDICADPKLLIATQHFVGEPGNALEFKMRIDTKPIRSFTGTYADTGIDWLGIYIDIDPTLLKELMAGHTARFQWEMQNGRNDVHAFTLMGFTRATTQASKACQQHQDYFDDSDVQI